MRRELGRDDLPASASPPTSGPAQMTELTNGHSGCPPKEKSNPEKEQNRGEGSIEQHRVCADHPGVPLDWTSDEERLTACRWSGRLTASATWNDPGRTRLSRPHLCNAHWPGHRVGDAGVSDHPWSPVRSRCACPAKALRRDRS